MLDVGCWMLLCICCVGDVEVCYVCHGDEGFHERHCRYCSAMQPAATEACCKRKPGVDNIVILSLQLPVPCGCSRASSWAVTLQRGALQRLQRRPRSLCDRRYMHVHPICHQRLL